MEADWKTTVEKEAEGLIDELKELNANEKWVANGDKPCDMFKMEIDSRMASKGVAVVEYPFEKVLEFFSDPMVSKKINEMCVNMEILHEEEGKYRIIHMEYKGTWPVANRDFVVVGTRRRDEDTFYIATRSTNYPK
jgi:hypothetical protein